MINPTTTRADLARSIATDAIRLGVDIETHARASTELLSPETRERIVRLALATDLSSDAR